MHMGLGSTDGWHAVCGLILSKSSASVKVYERVLRRCAFYTSDDRYLLVLLVSIHEKFAAASFISLEPAQSLYHC